MNVFEAIKNFQRFDLGDKVLWNDYTELTIMGLPVFYHRIYYGSGEFSEHESHDYFDGSHSANQTVLGYLVKNKHGRQFRLCLLAKLTLKNPPIVRDGGNVEYETS